MRKKNFVYLLFIEVSVNGGTLSNDEVFTSDIFESSDVCIDLSHIPDVSPIKDPGTNGPGTTEQHSEQTYCHNLIILS